jgi:hypothetical protein
VEQVFTWAAIHYSRGERRTTGEPGQSDSSSGHDGCIAHTLINTGSHCDNLVAGRPILGQRSGSTLAMQFLLVVDITADITNAVISDISSGANQHDGICNSPSVVVTALTAA